MSELKLSDIWDDATNAVCQAMQESKMCKCKDGECIAAKIEPSAETVRHWNTHAVPEVPELVTVAWKHPRTEYVSHKKANISNHCWIGRDEPVDLVTRYQAAEIIAAKDKEIDRLNKRSCDNGFCNTDHWYDRAKAVEAKLAQYEAQEPVGWLCEKLDGDDRFSKVVCNPLSVEKLMELGGVVTPLYASPAPAADLKAKSRHD